VIHNAKLLEKVQKILVCVNKAENITFKIILDRKKCFIAIRNDPKPKIMKLDKVDEAILECLSENSKQAIKEVAEQVGLSISPTHERIKKLEKNGIIQGYTVKLNKKAIGKGMTVLCSVSLKDHKLEHLKVFEERVERLSEVASCYHIAGEHDYVLIIEVADMEEYEHFLKRELTSIPSIANVHSSFVMSTVK
jgi:Lrp/AsnC family leucine-responsive transcriptional regulator